VRSRFMATSNSAAIPKTWNIIAPVGLAGSYVRIQGVELVVAAVSGK
jgi:hypothetical protein